MFRQKEYSAKEMDRLLARLVADKKTREEIKDEVKRLRLLQSTTLSPVEAWECNASLQILCWKYC